MISAYTQAARRELHFRMAVDPVYGLPEIEE